MNYDAIFKNSNPKILHTCQNPYQIALPFMTKIIETLMTKTNKSIYDKNNKIKFLPRLLH